MKSHGTLAFDQLKPMPWRDDFGDPDYRPGPRSDRGALVHWHKLLKEGYAASDIVRSAELYLQHCPADQVPTLAGFLVRYAERYADPESNNLFVPAEHNDHDQHGHHHDRHHLDDEDDGLGGQESGRVFSSG